MEQKCCERMRVWMGEGVRVEIFDVEHGACALVTAETGSRMLLDCGWNGSTGWRPSNHLPNAGIRSVDMLVVTNYDEDHVNDLPNLRRLAWDGNPNVQLRSILRNKTVSSRALQSMKSQFGMGNGIRELVSMIDEYSGGPLHVHWGALRYRVFRNSCPQEFTDSNNLSLVLFLHCHNLHVVFPGDMEKAGWAKLLENKEFVDELRSVNVFVASHHGRQSGCCEAVFEIDGVHPEIVIFSDAGIQYDSQNTAAWYRHRSRGIEFRGQRRHVFTTRHDGKITLEARPQSMTINTAK